MAEWPSRRVRRHGLETEERTQAFDQRYQRFSNRLEQVLTRAITLGLVVLTLSQLLLSIGAIRQVVSRVDVLEGIPWTQVEEWSRIGTQPTVPDSPRP